MTLNLTAYPQCAQRLHFQRANLNEAGFTNYWAAACVASGLSDTLLTDFGGFDFDDRSDANGKKLLSRLEQFFADGSQRAAGNSVFASEGLKAFLGSRGVKTSELKTEDDYWTAAEILFSGRIKRTGGFSSLYLQIQSIPKKERGALGRSNVHKLPVEWLGKLVDRRPSLRSSMAPAKVS